MPGRGAESLAWLVTKRVRTAQAAGYPIALYLDSKENKYVEEFSTSNFIAIDKGDTSSSPASSSPASSSPAAASFTSAFAVPPPPPPPPRHPSCRRVFFRADFHAACTPCRDRQLRHAALGLDPAVDHQPGAAADRR